MPCADEIPGLGARHRVSLGGSVLALGERIVAAHVPGHHERFGLHLLELLVELADLQRGLGASELVAPAKVVGKQVDLAVDFRPVTGVEHENRVAGLGVLGEPDEGLDNIGARRLGIAVRNQQVDVGFGEAEL